MCPGIRLHLAHAITDTVPAHQVVYLTSRKPTAVPGRRSLPIGIPERASASDWRVVSQQVRSYGRWSRSGTISTAQHCRCESAKVAFAGGDNSSEAAWDRERSGCNGPGAIINLGIVIMRKPAAVALNDQYRHGLTSKKDAMRQGQDEV